MIEYIIDNIPIAIYVAISGSLGYYYGSLYGYKLAKDKYNKKNKK